MSGIVRQSLTTAEGNPLLFRTRIFGVLVYLMLLSSVLPAHAKTSGRDVTNPPLLELKKVAPLATTSLKSIPMSGAPRAGIERQPDINIVYTDSRLYNPATGRYDNVRLRSDVGTDTSPTRPYVAPTTEVTPGDTVRVTLNNLPLKTSNRDIDTLLKDSERKSLQKRILVLRTRFQRYIGEYVLHCHILDQEDQGMKQNVSIILPDGQGGSVAFRTSLNAPGRKG